jgi:serine/threonine-protein kinase
MTDTGGGHLLGTLRYMSPEQLRGELPAAGWDIWALGIVAYEMLAGKYPFAGVTTAEWHVAVTTGRFTPVATPAWQTFFEHALAADQEKRPSTARTFFSDMEAALAIGKTAST